MDCSGGSGIDAAIGEPGMNFDYTPKVREMRERLLAFMTARVYPNERRYREEVESNPAIGARRGAHQSRIRAALRAHGPGHVGARGVQLQRAGYRQHGDDRALRHG